MFEYEYVRSNRIMFFVLSTILVITLFSAIVLWKEAHGIRPHNTTITMSDPWVLYIELERPYAVQAEEQAPLLLAEAGH